MAGIKETREVVAAGKEGVLAAAAAFEDGKIGLDDLPKFAKAAVAIKYAAEGLALVPVELKDLDGEEAKLLLGDVVDLVMAIGKLLGSVK